MRAATDGLPQSDVTHTCLSAIRAAVTRSDPLPTWLRFPCPRCIVAPMALLVNPDRFKADFDALAQIGSTGDGGVNRPALSEAHLEVRRWLQARAVEAGLETHVDGAGNHSVILRSTNPDARTLLLGSHTDSVPNGGGPPH